MKWIRDFVVHAPALCVALALAGCGSATDSTAPPRSSSPPNPSHTPAPAAAIVASYDLVEIGGKALPVTYSGGGATWAVTGGHYFLMADNTFAFGYDFDGSSTAKPVGTVVWVDATTVKFYQYPGSYPQSTFYKERNGLFATGRIEGSTMTVTYEDFIDFEVEKYVASGN